MEELGRISDMVVDSSEEDLVHPDCIARMLKTYLHFAPLVSRTIYKMLGETEYLRIRNSEDTSEAGNQETTPMDVDEGFALNEGSSHNSSSSTIVQANASPLARESANNSEALPGPYLPSSSGVSGVLPLKTMDRILKAAERLEDGYVSDDDEDIDSQDNTGDGYHSLSKIDITLARSTLFSSEEHGQ